MSAIHDAWLTRSPWDERPEYEQPRCSQCGAFLRDEPDGPGEAWEDGYDCDGTVDENGFSQCGYCEYRKGPAIPHHVVVAGGIKTIRTCKRCGHENVDWGV